MDTLLPHIGYQNVAEASEWRRRVFGFSEAYRYGVLVSGVQMRMGQAYIMLQTARQGYGTQSLTVFVEDVGAHHAAAKQAGARIVEEINETIYGERQYGAQDLCPDDWDATSRQ